MEIIAKDNYLKKIIFFPPGKALQVEVICNVLLAGKKKGNAFQ